MHITVLQKTFFSSILLLHTCFFYAMEHSGDVKGPEHCCSSVAAPSPACADGWMRVPSIKEREKAAEAYEKCVQNLSKSDRAFLDSVYVFGLKLISDHDVCERERARGLITRYPELAYMLQAKLPDKEKIDGLPMTYKVFDSLSPDEQDCLRWIHSLDGISREDVEQRKRLRALMVRHPEFAAGIRKRLPGKGKVVRATMPTVETAQGLCTVSLSYELFDALAEQRMLKNEFDLKGLADTDVEMRTNLRALINKQPELEAEVRTLMPDKEKVERLPISYNQFDSLPYAERRLINVILKNGLKGVAREDIYRRSDAMVLAHDRPELAPWLQAMMPDRKEQIEGLPITYEAFEVLAPDAQLCLSMMLNNDLKGSDQCRVKMRKVARILAVSQPMFADVIRAKLDDKKLVRGMPLSYEAFDGLVREEQMCLDQMLNYGLKGADLYMVAQRKMARSIMEKYPELAPSIKKYLAGAE